MSKTRNTGNLSDAITIEADKDVSLIEGLIIGELPNLDVDKFLSTDAIGKVILGVAPGGRRFGIEDILGVQNRAINLDGFSLDIINTNTDFFQTSFSVSMAYFDDDISTSIISNVNGSIIQASDALGNDKELLITPTEVKVATILSGFSQGSIIFPVPLDFLDHYLAVSVNGEVADSTGNITLENGIISEPLVISLGTTAPLPASTYNNGTAGVGATLTGDGTGILADIDGVTPIEGILLLIKDQVDQTENGVYIVTQLGDGANPFILTRSTASDETSELYPQGVTVANGDTNASFLFVQNTVDPAIGTDDIVYGFFTIVNPTWQQTLDNSSTLDRDNTVIGGGFDFSWNDMNHLINTAVSTARLNIGVDTNGDALRIIDNRIPLSVLRIFDGLSVCDSGSCNSLNISLTDNSGVQFLSIDARKMVWTKGIAVQFSDNGIWFNPASTTAASYYSNNKIINNADFSIQTITGLIATGSGTQTVLIKKDTGAMCVGVGATYHVSAMLQADSTSKGFLPPRMNTTQKNAISTPAEGLTVYDSTTHKLCVYDGSVWQDAW